MAFKFGTYFSHHAGDPLKSGSLIANLFKHGRDLIEGVSGLGGRKGAGAIWQIGGATTQPVRVVVRSNVSGLSVVCRSQQPVVALKNIFHGLFRCSHPETLASRYAQKINPPAYWSTFRSNEQFRSLGKRLATLSFVGMSFAVGSQMQPVISDDGFMVFDDVCSDIRNMFVDKQVCKKSSVKGDELGQAKLEDYEFGEVLTTSTEFAVFEAKTKLNAWSNHLVAVKEIDVCSAEIISDGSVELDQISLLSDQPSLECELTVAVEMASNQPKLLNEIVQAVHNQNCTLSNWINQTLDMQNTSASMQCIDIADFSDSNLDCSFEVIDGWQESLADVMIIDEEYNGEGDESSEDDDYDDGDVLELLAGLEDLAKKRRRELTEVLSVISNQTKRIVSIVDAYQTAIDENNKMAARVIWMTDRSVEYCNRIMMRELLPAVETTCTPETWKLPAHFNVAPVIGGFLTTLDSVKKVASSHHALPVVHKWQQDIAMCIVTKRYEFTLAEYLASHSLTFSESVMLFLQLLEAVVHMNENDVWHGDLKSENIHVEILPGGPHLLVANFGSSSRIRAKFGFLSPNTEMRKYSHSYLMAPEVATAGSSLWSNADYSKADLWACGALAYELFGCANPFRQVHNGKRLTSSEYEESDLPSLPDFVPSYISGLVKMLLKRNPRKRPDPELAANVLHIGLWAPHQWQTSAARTVNIKQWMTQFAAVTYCYQRAHRQLVACSDGSRAIADTLKVLFLSRANFSSVADAARLIYYLNS